MLDTRDEWRFLVQRCELTSDVVHVWLVDLEHVAHYGAPLTPLLHRRERERAASFRFEHDRERYVSAHVLLRLVLEQYLDLAPQRFAFRLVTMTNRSCSVTKWLGGGGVGVASAGVTPQSRRFRPHRDTRGAGRRGNWY